MSVMYTRADSGMTSLEDMKGHSLAWADPNSASGYLIPRAEFGAQGIDPSLASILATPVLPAAMNRRWSR